MWGKKVKQNYVKITEHGKKTPIKMHLYKV